MGGADDNMSTTPTGGQGNGYAAHQQTSRRQSTQSADYQPQNVPFPTTHENIDPNSRYPSNSSYQQQPVQPYSRPSSGLSGAGDRNGYPQTYQEPNQKSAHQTDPARDQSSVVIKVGMVGDAQIGKTSLMVKYVEGSWDEDYIQTLGRKLIHVWTQPLLTNSRRKFHGENHFNTKYRDHFFDMGFRRSERICEHAPTSLQRCRGHSLHVRSHPEEHFEFHQRMVQARARLQQDRYTFSSRNQI